MFVRSEEGPRKPWSENKGEMLLPLPLPSSGKDGEGELEETSFFRTRDKTESGSTGDKWWQARLLRAPDMCFLLPLLENETAALKRPFSRQLSLPLSSYCPGPICERVLAHLCVSVCTQRLPQSCPVTPGSTQVCCAFCSTSYNKHHPPLITAFFVASQQLAFLPLPLVQHWNPDKQPLIASSVNLSDPVVKLLTNL